MKSVRFGAVPLILTVAALLTPALPAVAADAAGWPNRVIRLVVPFSAGSVVDRIGRVLAQQLENKLQQPVVVENRTGAGAIIAADYVARAKPDGYTFLIGLNASHAVNPAYMKLPYDAVKSFEPITLISTTPSVLLVRPTLKIDSLKELVAMAKAEPGKLTFGSSGIGTMGHLGMEMLTSMMGVQLLHVPSKGPVQVLQDVMAGHVDMLMSAELAPAAELIKNGRMRAIGITGKTRNPALPDVPTLDEAGATGYELLLWFALYAPAGTPQDIVNRMSAVTSEILRDPEVAGVFKPDGVALGGSTPQELAAFQKVETEKFRALIQKLDLKLGQ